MEIGATQEEHVGRGFQSSTIPVLGQGGTKAVQKQAEKYNH